MSLRPLITSFLAVVYLAGQLIATPVSSAASPKVDTTDVFYKRDSGIGEQRITNDTLVVRFDSKYEPPGVPYTDWRKTRFMAVDAPRDGPRDARFTPMICDTALEGQWQWIKTRLLDSELKVHSGNYCKNPTGDAFIFDNLWIEYKGQFRNVPEDCWIQYYAHDQVIHALHRRRALCYFNV